MASQARSTTLLGVLLLLAAPLGAQNFRPDDPVLIDPDRMPIDEPGEIELSTSHDVLYHSLGDRGHGHGVRAANINTLGEVPDSSWFQNRIGIREIPTPELVLGPATVGGPDASAPWTVVAGKSQGITPGFRIIDGRGDMYFIKFDSRSYPHLATAVDVIGTKFFHAFGYHVPENTIARFRREDLRVDPEARLTRGKKKRPMKDEDIDDILALAPRESDGTYRVVASRALPGKPIGHRLFFGTRGDDANDIFPHEDRRELRGFRVFCAWLNHDDSRALNSLDVFIPDGERGHVDHYLIDFSSILGAGSDAQRRIAPQNPRAGNQYVLEGGPTFKTAVSLGVWERPWRHVKYQERAEIGRIEADFFQPQLWKPEYPNPAFKRMSMEDAFWATRIVARFTDEAITALVATGEYDDPIAERFLGQMIQRRRDKVLAYYLRQLAPLDEFEIRGADAPRIEFVHLGERHGLGAVSGYAYEWSVFDNDTSALTALGGARVTEPALPIPKSEAAFLKVRIRTEAESEAAWQLPVDVYLRNAPDGPSVVGIERAATDRSLE